MKAIQQLKDDRAREDFEELCKKNHYEIQQNTLHYFSGSQLQASQSIFCLQYRMTVCFQNVSH